MKNRSLVNKLWNAKIETEAGITLREALRTVLSCNLALYDTMTDSELLTRLTDAIRYEYFPRPRWGTGEPVHAGDYYMKDDALRRVTCVRSCVKSDNDSEYHGELFGCYARIEPDTQERIASDSELSPYEYVSRVLKQYKTNMSSYEMQQLMVQDLLCRQRELDGREV